MQILLVVSDRFNSFASRSCLMTYSELLIALRGGGSQSFRGVQFVAGQGLDEMQIDHAYCLALSQGLEAEFAHWRLWRRVVISDEAMCHKHRSENVLISPPVKSDEGLFVSELLIHSHNELVLDHLTGEHVQGMVLLEACRQMFLAVTELHCLDGFTGEMRYFVINEMAVRYLAFAFPLPAQIRYRLLSSERTRPNRLVVQASMEIWQCGLAVTDMDVKFAVFNAKELREREARLADEAVMRCVESAQRQIPARAMHDRSVPATV